IKFYIFFSKCLYSDSEMYSLLVGLPPASKSRETVRSHANNGTEGFYLMKTSPVF
ncbi:hypothetical protein J6590_087588, partial [Homalodisca vitripennis]